jgi:hypothetical protein
MELVMPRPKGGLLPAPLRAFTGLSVLVLAIFGLMAVIFYLKAHGAGLWAFLTAIAIFYVIGLALVSRRFRHVAPRIMPPASKRYEWRLFIALVLYCIVLLLVLAISDAAQPSGVLAYSLAFAPAIPLLAIFATLRQEPDEFRRTVFAESALWTTGCFLAIATVWGLLEMFHLVPHAESWLAFPLWVVLNAPIRILMAWRYQ